MEFEPMKPPENLVDNMIKESLSEAWLICFEVEMYNDKLFCGETGYRCFVFQDGKECANNPRNRVS